MPLDRYFDHEELRGDLGRRDLADVVGDLLFQGHPWLFSDSPDVFVDLQAYVSRELGDAEADVILVGSAATGYSVSPDSFARVFMTSSDLDFLVISPLLFDTAWNCIRRWCHPRRNNLPAREDDWFQERQAQVFWGWFCGAVSVSMKSYDIEQVFAGGPQLPLTARRPV
jgi:hypothetical protein